MYLQKLEIQGFKSFAQKVTFTFNRGITAVVGPNGSGKSNVADAIRWVLGEQSMKLLRGKRAEDVIFAGSDKKNRLGSAEVSVHFNNEDGRAPIDASEFVITRRIFRNGESDYLLNTQPTRLTDIALLLAKSNFGQRSYSIIGQGMIDEVLAATPQGRKVFFDEAAGVRAFQIKKEQAEMKLDQTKENLTRVDLLVQEIEPRLRSLTRQVKRLEQRSVVEEELRGHQVGYYRSLWHEISSQLSRVQGEHEIQSKQKKAREQERDEVQRTLTDEEARGTREDAFSALQKEYQRLVDEKHAILREQSALQGERDAELTSEGKGDVVWLERRIAELQRLQSTIEERLTELSHDELALEESENTLQKKQSDSTKQYNDAQSRLVRLQEQATKTITLTDVSASLDSVCATHVMLLRKIKNAESIEQIALLHAELDDLHEQLQLIARKAKNAPDEATTRALGDIQKELHELVAVKEALATESAQHAAERRALQERRREREEDMQQCATDLAEAQQQLQAASAQGPERSKILSERTAKLSKRLVEIEEAIAVAREKIARFNAQEQEKKDRLVALQKQFAEIVQEVNGIGAQVNQYAVEIARLETRREDIDREMRQEIPDVLREQVCAEKPETDIDRGAVYAKIMQVKKQLELIGGIDPQVTQEYEQTKERYDFLTSQINDLQKAIADLESAIVELDHTIKSRFDQAFNAINKEFSIYFKKLFGGGKASLELLKEDVRADDDDDADDDGDDDDEDDEPVRKGRTEKVITGIAIYATPPGKKLKNVSTLSGGERALTSIALICAIIANNPSPFVVLDEVDAALDEANSERFATIISQLANKTQFITVTHNRATMEHASLLYGITMGDDGVSRMLSVDVEHAEDMIKRHGNR